MARTTLSLILLSIIATQAMAQLSQTIELYTEKDCRGRKIRISEQYVEDLGVLAWNDIAKSVSVTGGWILYEHGFYNRGSNSGTEFIANSDCTNLQYLPEKVSSLRFAGDKSNYRINSVTLYKSRYFQEDEEFTTQDLRNLNMQEQASFIITGKAGWTFYDRTNFQGNSICVSPPNTDSPDPYFVPDMDQILNIRFNSIRSIKLGCA
ncbi:unnamed protein product [Allacma fusca]|uniref:Beta/gamma crystallin 'Greek key' domain-containing protein n=1 Tax=Allacma fusca TaxID=39272 RepID=A0A8J2KGL5_9HEXA|nr:unnamed protein product [Allacma fusca]